MISDSYTDILNNLSDKERETALRIIEELSRSDNSTILKALIDADWIEQPVDIMTFITDDMYLGRAWKDANGNLKLYPYWVDRLKELFPSPTEISVNNAIFSGGRGLGKSEVAIIIGAYLMYRVICLRNPHEYFGLKRTEQICFAFMNITKELAEEIAISKFQNTILMSPWFRSKCRLTQRNNEPYLVPPEPVEIIIGSQSSHVIGRPIYFAFFDEISFIRNQNIDRQKQIAIDMIDTAIGGMKTRFIRKGKNPTLLVLASSKRSDKSFLEVHMRQKVQNDGDNVLIVDEAVWKVKPPGTYSDKTFAIALGNKFLPSKVLDDNADLREWADKGYKIIHAPIDFLPNFLEDIDRALCDFAGISSTELSKYISGDAVRDIIDETYRNPFTKDIIEVGNGSDDKLQYFDFFDLSKIDPILKYKPLFIHLDMSISGDMTGIAGIWISGKKTSTDASNLTRDLSFTLAFSVSVKAPKGHQVSFEKNRNFIFWLKEMGFKIKGISTDSFQAYDTGQALLKRGLPYEMLSVDKIGNDHINKPYQYFKSTIYEKRLRMYRSNTLIDELIDLERNINTGKVDHPNGGRKDISDAVCGALFNASKHAEEFSYEFGDDITSTINVSQSSQDFGKQQMTLDFEAELNKLLDPLAGNRKSDTSSPTDSQFTDFGMGKATTSYSPYLGNGIILW